MSNSEDKSRQGIQIRRLKQGFLVTPDLLIPQDELAFSDALDLAEWLVCWLGFGVGWPQKVRDTLVEGYAAVSEANESLVQAMNKLPDPRDGTKI